MGGRGSGSMTAAQREAVRTIDEYLDRMAPEVDSVISEVKAALLDAYADTRYTSEANAEKVRAVLEDYEPTITESDIADIFGDNYGEVLSYLEGVLADHDIYDTEEFYINWNTVRTMTDEKKRILAGQMVLR